MNNRRAIPSQRYGSDQSLLRCAIALCSNPAVADNVCEMHHSSGGGNSTLHRPNGYGSGGSPFMNESGSGGFPGENSDRYRSMNNFAHLPPSRANKKQKTGSDMSHDHGMNMGTMAPSRPLGKQYTPLTHENLSMANRSSYSSSSSMSAYDSNPYISQSRPTQGSTNDSLQSDSESQGGDRETSLRRERNRIAARKSRQRKLDRISNLEEEKMRLEQHRDMLVQEIRSLEKKDSGVTNTNVMSITDREYSNLQHARLSIIKAVENAYNTGDVLSTMEFFRDDSIVSGPQNSSVHLRGKDSLILDYLCTTYLFGDITLEHVKVDSGGPRSQHFRVHWLFTGIVKSAGVSMNKEFLELIENVKGKRVRIEGVSNFSFSGEKIVYIHRTADQAKFLSSLVNISKD